MLSRIHKRLTYTNLAITLTLVFAMTGGAYAAKRYLITSTKQISPKVLKELKGNIGPSGMTGTNGTNGKDGAPGERGMAGRNGRDGESVTSKEVKVGDPACNKLGGSEFKVGSDTPRFACNGEKGESGEPWVPNNTLPAGATETGAWSFSDGAANIRFGIASISFTIPLKAPLTGTTDANGNPTQSQVHYLGENEKTTECPGNDEEPKALPGNLCIYQSYEQGVKESGGNNKAAAFIEPPKDAVAAEFLVEVTLGTGTSGAVIWFPAKENETRVIGAGAWAVTAGE